jgi:hypothetical protein
LASSPGRSGQFAFSPVLKRLNLWVESITVKENYQTVHLFLTTPKSNRNCGITVWNGLKSRSFDIVTPPSYTIHIIPFGRNFFNMDCTRNPFSCFMPSRSHTCRDLVQVLRWFTLTWVSQYDTPNILPSGKVSTTESARLPGEVLTHDILEEQESNFCTFPMLF